MSWQQLHFPVPIPTLLLESVCFRLSFKAGNDYSLCWPILKATTCLKFVGHFQLNSPQCPGDSLQGAAEMGKRVQEMRNGNSEGGGQSELIFFDELR